MKDWKVDVEKYCEWLKTGKGKKPDLQGANLRGADLRRADLRRAYLQDADLPAPSIILLANWRELSDKTTIALMRLDCSACLNGKKRFDIWAHDGICPYNESKVQRVANFVEKKHLWKYGPPPSIYNCMKMVLDEKCPGWNKK